MNNSVVNGIDLYVKALQLFLEGTRKGIPFFCFVGFFLTWGCREQSDSKNTVNFIFHVMYVRMQINNNNKVKNIF